MSPDIFLHGLILYLDRLFTWNSANSVTDRSGVYLGPCKLRDQSRHLNGFFKLSAVIGEANAFSQPRCT